MICAARSGPLKRALPSPERGYHLVPVYFFSLSHFAYSFHSFSSLPNSTPTLTSEYTYTVRNTLKQNFRSLKLPVVKMNNTLRSLPRAASRCLRPAKPQTPRSFPAFSQTRAFSITPRVYDPSATRPPPPPPEAEAEALSKGDAGPAPTYLGTTKRLPEFNLVDKVVLVSGAARGLGLVQAEALLEAGAIGTYA